MGEESPHKAKVWRPSAINGFPIGAIIGTILSLAALELNTQGLIAFSDAMKQIRVDLTAMVTFLATLYFICILCDFIIVSHGLFVWCSSKSWNMCRFCSFPFCVTLSFIGSITLWAVFVLLLAQLAAGCLLTFIFFAIGETCDAAVDSFIAKPADNETLSTWYQRSGIKTMIKFVSEPPIKLKLAGEVDQLATKATESADAFLDALEQFCDFFTEDITEACSLVTIGAFAAVCAQVVIMVYQSKYYAIHFLEKDYAKAVRDTIRDFKKMYRAEIELKEEEEQKVEKQLNAQEEQKKQDDTQSWKT
mmetsp:Transcript_6466/g.8915  ORF Transcript_6466/g.8915 Transcript_6466/m.8915 type:complete len:305 (-) Transcript_6466:173-1087(-)